MSGVRVLLARAKGAFVMTADGTRDRSTISRDAIRLRGVAGEESFLVVGAMAGG